MSEENVEIVREVIEAFRSGMERGDPGAAFDLESASDDFELITMPFEGRTVWRGREGWVEFIRVWTEEFDDWSLQIERQIDGREAGAKNPWECVSSSWRRGSATPTCLPASTGRHGFMAST